MLQPANDVTLLSANEAELREKIASSLTAIQSYAHAPYERSNDYQCILTHLRSMLTDGRLTLALKVGTILTEEVLKWLASNRSHHHVVTDLRSFWIEAMLHFDLPDADRPGWAEKLEAWDATLPILAPSARNGWSSAPIKALLRGEQTPYDEPGPIFEARLACLRKAKRMQEAINFVRATGKRLSGPPQRELITDLLIHRYVEEALCEDVTSSLDPEEKYYLAKHVASVRPFDAFKLAQSGLREIDHPRWQQFREPMAVWLLNHAIECDLFLNRTRTRPPLPVTPKPQEMQCLVPLKDIPIDASVPSLYMLCVRRIGTHRPNMSLAEWNDLISDLPLPVKASLMVEEAARMCSVSYAFSQEHTMRCSVLLQLKGYTALALDTLCQSVSDNVTAFKYLLRQAIASRQRKLLDSVVARLIEQSDLMNSYDDEVLLPCIDELSVSRPFDALRILVRVLRKPEGSLAAMVTKLGRDVATSELLSLVVVEDRDDRRDTPRYAFFLVAQILADRGELLEAAKLALRCLHMSRFVTLPQEWQLRVSAFLIKHATAAAAALGGQSVYDALMEAWLKHRTAHGYMKMRDLAKSFGLWEKEGMRLNDLVSTISADVVQKLEIRLDEGNVDAALDLWVSAMEEGTLSRFVERLLQARPGCESVLLDKMLNYVWSEMWQRRVGAYVSVYELNRVLLRLAPEKRRPEVSAATEAADPLIALGQLLWNLAASRPTYAKVINQLNVLLPVCQRAKRLDVFQSIIDYLRSTHAGKRTLQNMLDEQHFPAYTLPPAAASRTLQTQQEHKKRRR